MSHPIRRRAVLSAGAASVAAVAASAAASSSGAAPLDHLLPPVPVGTRALSKNALPGGKWDIAKNVRRFRGVTVVAAVAPGSPFHRAQAAALTLIDESRYRNFFATLPLASMHMTVLEGPDEGKRQKSSWTSLAPRDASIATVAQRLLAALDARPDLRAPRPIRMRIEGPDDFTTSPIVKLRPADVAMMSELTRFRTATSEALGLPTTDIASYQFHSTLAYILVTPRAEDIAGIRGLQDRVGALFRDVRTVDLEPAAFTVFDSMLAFAPLKYLA